MSFKTNLVEEFNSELNEVSKITVGTDEHKIAVDSLTKLADRIIEIDKLESEIVKNEREEAFKYEQLDEQKRDRKSKTRIAVGTAAVSLIAYGLTYAASLRFESRGGILTDEGGKNALKNLLKLKF